MKKIKTGVIGTGNMGVNHVRIYKMLHACCELKGVYDVDMPRAEKTARAYQTVFFDNQEELFSRVDAVSIAVPTIFHYDTAKAALEHGLHVLLEKPIAQTAYQGKELMALADDKGLVLQIGHVERFNPAVQILPEIIKGKKIVALDFKRMSPYNAHIQDVDVVADLMIHDIDILRFLIPEKIKSIEAFGVAPKSDFLKDHAVATILLNKGIIASFTASRVTEQKVRKIAITAEDAFIELDYIERKIMIYRAARVGFGGGPEPSYRQESMVEKVFVPNHEPLFKELESFIQCVQGHRKPQVTAADGIAALEVVESIQEKIYGK